MKIAKTIKETREIIRKQKANKKIIGLVPTMGALHEGHLSLIMKAREQTDFLIVSIFVNPLQFGPNEDYTEYPRNHKEDEVLLKKEGVDLIFYPGSKIMYPEGFSTYVEEKYLSKTLCGESRPGHFKGVTTIVAKLFNIINPDIAYFGQKDYQQAQIIKRMTHDLNFPITIKILPTVRDKKGLAQSSRNSYLTQKEYKDALVLSESLKLARQLFKNGQKNALIIKKSMVCLINSIKTAKIDYVEIVDGETLRTVKIIYSGCVIVAAVFIGKTRLIDNIMI